MASDSKKSRRTTVFKDLEENQQNLSWEEAVSQFLDDMKVRGLAYHTRRWHSENLSAVVKVLRLKQYPTEPAMVTESVVKDVVLVFVDRGLKSITIGHRVRSLKQFYKFLVAQSFVEIDPTLNLERKKSQNVFIQTFSEEQLTALFAVPDKTRFVGLRDYVIMLLFLDTGIRLSELVGVKLYDLKLADNELVIPHGKGDKFRRVFLSSKTRDALKKYLRVRGDIPGNPYLFVNYENTPMCGRNVQQRLTDYGKKAKLEGVRVSPHTFRHTFAKMYIIRGGDPFSLQALLGHSTLEMVRLYVNLWGTDLQRIHRQFSPVDNLHRPL